MDFLSARGESVHQLQFGSLLTIISNNTEEFPSGQREQTVNLSAMPSVVRIHPLPPRKDNPKLVIIGNSFGFSVYIDTKQG